MMINLLTRTKNFFERKLNQKNTLIFKDLQHIPMLNIVEFGLDNNDAFVILKDGKIFFSFLSNNEEKELCSRCLHLLPKGFKEECFRVILDIIQRYIRENSVWPIPPKTYYLEKGSGFIDLGSYIGYGALKASKIVGPNGQVIAVEGSKKAYEILLKNVNANKIKNVKTINAAINNFDGSTNFYGLDKQNNSIISEFKDQIDGEERSYINSNKVKAKKVDTIIKEDGFDFLKKSTHISFEINGGELIALEGMQDFLINGENFTLRIAARYGKTNKPLREEISQFLQNYKNINVVFLNPYVYVIKNHK